ncbi:MAG: family 20 glycosylhydrolase [Acidobacteria bacterium]|nr:family 20 glycosylhydrolase [Acidobacteriota bacterium]
MPHTLSRSLARGLAASAFVFLLASAARAQAAAQTGAQDSPRTQAIQIIPRPRQLAATGERFPVTPRTRLALADARSEDDRFAAADFNDDLRQTAGLALKVGGRRDRDLILVGLVDHPAVQSALKRAGLDVPANLNAEGYALCVTPREVVVAGKTPAGTFYGLQTLKQLVRGEGASAYVQGAKIVDWPAMRWRGFFDDINRGPVPTLDYIKRQLRTGASFKLNMHSFNLENIVEWKSHPLLGPEGGALAQSEVRELVAYARRYHVELVPQQQTFGHLRKVLTLEKYAPLAESQPAADVLSPQRPETYRLVADWYKELAELFPGKFFHIGADEVFELAEGQSREQVKDRGVGFVYFEHLRRVRELLAPHNRRLMFWGDIALRHPELIASVPREMIVMNWTYGPRDDYTARIKPFKDAGLEQFVCPGVHSWNQIFPAHDQTARNVVNFVRDGQRAGALGAMNTQWDDDGESLFEMAWYGVVLGAAASWQEGELGVEGFERDFDWAFFRADGDRFVRSIRTLGSVNTLLNVPTTNPVFWQEPFTPAFHERARTLREKTKQMRLAVEEVEETVKREGPRARRNRTMLPALVFAARRFDHLGRRMQVVEQFSQEYWRAYLNLADQRQVSSRLRRYHGPVYNHLREMAEELSLLRAAYRERWLAENRPYWLDSITARYDRAIQVWLDKSKALEEAVRDYNETSILPNPEEFGLGPRPTP